ncbi:MAG: hypothetical protein IJ678_08915, partial [Kiritimatiellae bacterium]|nr:hypothetical protein [Kiritimatiellia bacterium]
RAAFAIDDARAFARLPFDVVCDDTRAGRPGESAPAVAAARLAAFRADPSLLYGIDFCTALYDAAWNIYAPMADFVIAKPYRLHWGRTASRWIEEEIGAVDLAVAAAAPKPVVWVPDRFKRRRHVEGRELELLAWCAALRGAKGVRHHFWLNDRNAPFADCRDVGETLPRLNRALADLRPVLSPLVPDSARTDRRAAVSVLEGWSGDAGALLLVRNLRYRTDEEPDDGGRAPRFRTTPAENVAVPYPVPPWLHPGQPVDPIAGERYPSARAGDVLTVSLPRLDVFRLVWIPNTQK